LQQMEPVAGGGGDRGEEAAYTHQQAAGGVFVYRSPGDAAHELLQPPYARRLEMLRPHTIDLPSQVCVREMQRALVCVWCVCVCVCVCV